jgi:hypothetical protein
VTTSQDYSQGSSGKQWHHEKHQGNKNVVSMAGI